MGRKFSRKSADLADSSPHQPTPEEFAIRDEAEAEPPHASSLSRVATEAMRTGIYPEKPRMEEIPGEDELLRAGDPDVSPLENAYIGSDIPGGSTPTPDQSGVDEIGEVYGVSALDSGRISIDRLMSERDRNRPELEGPIVPDPRKETDNAWSMKSEARIKNKELRGQTP